MRSCRFSRGTCFSESHPNCRVQFEYQAVCYQWRYNIIKWQPILYIAVQRGHGSVCCGAAECGNYRLQIFPVGESSMKLLSQLLELFSLSCFLDSACTSGSCREPDMFLRRARAWLSKIPSYYITPSIQSCLQLPIPFGPCGR